MQSQIKMPIHARKHESQLWQIKYKPRDTCMLYFRNVLKFSLKSGLVRKIKSLYTEFLL